MAKLPADHVEQIEAALLSGYSLRTLTRMVRLQMNEILNEIADGSNLTDTVFTLIVWADRNGRVDDLIDGACKGNPGNSDLQQLALAAKGWADNDTKPKPVDEDYKYVTKLVGVDLRVHMTQVQTGVYHLFDLADKPLVTCRLTNLSDGFLRLRVRVRIEHYSAEEVHTVELEQGESEKIPFLPPIFSQRTRDIQALTRAALHVVVENITEHVVIEQHNTVPLWLLSRNSVPMAAKDLVTEKWDDLTRYLGAYVTPTAPAILNLLHSTAMHHPNCRLVGYQAEVETQAEAIYNSLKDQDIVYVDSLMNDFSRETMIISQRVRLPSESLAEHVANDIDCVLLFASLLQGISINPCIVLVPRHAFVGWETASGNDDWQYLETTMLQTHDFRKALDLGIRRTATYIQRFETTGDPAWFRRWSLRDLRFKHGIMPME